MMLSKLFRFILNTIPRPVLIRLSYVSRLILPFFLRGNKFEDPIDGRTYRKLLPYGYGEAQRPNALSPGSNSLERHRLLWLYLKRETDFFTKPAKMLHVAPEQCFYGLFRKQQNLNYLTADLDSPIADVKMDIHDIQYPDNTFDIIFCNHVLEHVRDDQQCMRELHRVLKPGGMAIMQVPHYPDEGPTIEDPDCSDPEERKRRFGQYDHIRKYGNDYDARLEKAGFQVRAYDYSLHLAPELAERYALAKGEILYVCSK
jgi:SAM-dependent methyltransferase